jgi:SAM-dependent methyltransferase
MDARAYEIMAQTADRHWWWSGRRAILRAVLRDLHARGALPPGALYDLGCGVGANLPVLREFGHAVGLDGSELAVRAAHHHGRGDVHLADLAHGVAALSGHAAGSAAVVLFADVLEHLDDEGPALALADHLLGPGGVLLVTVPALPALWGPSDEFNHHRRRYTRATLAGAIRRTFTVERLTYFNSLLFAPIAAARAVSRLARRPGHEEIGLPPAPVNALLRGIFSAEAALLTRTDLPLGVSLLCVARKGARPTKTVT